VSQDETAALAVDLGMTVDELLARQQATALQGRFLSIHRRKLDLPTRSR